MEEVGLNEIKNLQAELFKAKYGLKYYSEKFEDLTVQVEQLSKFAAQPALHLLTSYLSQNIFSSNKILILF